MSAMPLIEDPTSKLIEQVLVFRNLRHDVIASNIANANTPGYKAFDLVLQEQMDETMPLDRSRLVRSREPARLDGNNVSVDQELQKLLENRTMYEVGMELMDRWGSLKKIAREVR